MHPQDALFRGHPEAQRKPVVARPAVDVHPVRSTRPEAVIGDPVAEDEAEERPWEPEAHETDLPAVRVAREHEIALSRREMLERPWIVEQHDARRALSPRVRRADALHAGFPITPRVVHA